jgi:hypothetical protein
MTIEPVVVVGTRVVVVVPLIRQPVKVAAYTSVHDSDVVATPELMDWETNSAQDTRASVTVVLSFAEHLLGSGSFSGGTLLGGSPTFHPHPPGTLHFGPLQIC